MKILQVLFILSAIWISANEMAVPERWQPPTIAGKEYLVGLKPRKYIIEDAKMMETPLFRDAIWVIYRDSGIAVDFLGKALKRTDLHYNAAITKTRNPLLIKTTCYYTETEKNVGITEESWKAFKEASGDRIVGTMSCECIQSYSASKKRYDLPAAKSREEAYEQLRGTWNCRTMSQFRDLSVFYDWGLPRYAGTATYFDHMLMEFGSKCAGHESGCGINDMPMQIAVSRGAARQYGTFFYSYFASHCRTLNYPGQDTTLRNTKSYSHRDYYNFLAPYERRTNFLPPHKIGIKVKPWNTYTSSGPECGIMDCDYLRCMIYSYMGGCGIYIDESGQKFMHSLYDHRTIDQDDPLVINLRDRKYHVSKTGEKLVDFYGRVASKIDRGVVCTPIGLVWDRYHGYGPKYSGAKPWGGLFPLPGDAMFSALENFIFPVSPLTVEAVTCRTSPFGDIFDVITNDASQEAMDAYPALLLTGDVSMGRGFGERLLAYVKKGGILIASRCQLKELEGLPELSGKDGVSELALGKGRLIVSSKDYWLEATGIDASLGDVIRKVAGEQLPVKVEGDVQYMVNKTGEGVIVALFNNYGNVQRRTWEKPDQGLDASETRKVSIALRHAASEAVELISERSLSVNGGKIEIEVPGGDVKLVRIKKKLN